MSVNQFFHKLSHKVANAVGSVWAFIVALLLCIIWAFTGPHYHYSATWQLVINTATTIITFLMVFLIQNTQNRDSKATQLKLDELIRAQRGARNMLVDLENCTEEELEQLHKEFERVRRKALFRDHQKYKDHASSTALPGDMESRSQHINSSAPSPPDSHR